MTSSTERCHSQRQMHIFKPSKFLPVKLALFSYHRIALFSSSDKNLIFAFLEWPYFCLLNLAVNNNYYQESFHVKPG